MAHNKLFKELCNFSTMRVGWHLAQADSRDDFVKDPVGNADFASNLDSRLHYLIEQIQTYSYRPRYLLEVDIPKSGLSVRPGDVLPIEEASLLHAIVYLLAPLLDKKLDESVYSYRLHPNWQRRIKKRDSMFREGDVEFPFLKKATIRSINPFASWYELWPEFETEAIKAYTEEGFTHLTKTDISAYFENIDLRLLENQIRSLLKREEEDILQVMFRVLEGWTRVTSTGTPIGRGIPQGNEISAFLGNIYLVPLDRALIKFCKKRDAKWYRYVDDVKVFTKSKHDAREVVFVINEALRTLRLNLQGSKTDILSGTRLKEELDNSEFELIDKTFDLVRNFKFNKHTDRKQITIHLKPLSGLVSRFRKGLPESVTNLNTKQNRIFRRMMTLYGQCGRVHLKKSAFSAMKQLPDLRILNKTLSYVSRLHMSTHDETIEELFDLLETDELPFPYQRAMVLKAIANLHPSSPDKIASRIRAYGLTGRNDWIVIKNSLETIAVYPYRTDYSFRIAQKYLKHEHPYVRRAACVLLTRGPKDKLRKHLDGLIQHADPGVSRLSLYLQRFISDKVFANRELARMNKSDKTDFIFQRSLTGLYSLSATENKEIACNLHDFLSKFPKTRSQKNAWHKAKLLKLTDWSIS